MATVSKPKSAEQALVDKFAQMLDQRDLDNDEEFRSLEKKIDAIRTRVLASRGRRRESA